MSLRTKTSQVTTEEQDYEAIDVDEDESSVEEEQDYEAIDKTDSEAELESGSESESD